MSASVSSLALKNSRSRRDFGSFVFLLPLLKGRIDVKKLLSLLVCFGLVIGMSSLVGCGDDKKPAADSTKPKPAADSTKPAADAKKP